MARSARQFEFADAAVEQASFDFLPQDVRLRQRFGGATQLAAAQRRAQLRLIDAQVQGLGSRIVAQRLREILQPVAQDDIEAASGALVSADALVAARAELREIGNAIFYFRNAEDEADTPADQQPLHPRPLPARYFAA
ncbi:hypothetical protein [Dongia sp.]|uniref:hypothetical protein n=1 Tax=Dongia sp. TaxID=1977262 RepID=UPI0035B33D2C